jgi:hypothetical protein
LLGNHWGHVNTRREFFDAFARQNGFDPLNPENWYEVDTAAIYATKVLFENFIFSVILFLFCFLPCSNCLIFPSKNGRGALGGYNHSLINALMHVYPNIGLVKSKFFQGKKIEMKGNWDEERGKEGRKIERSFANDPT